MPEWIHRKYPTRQIDRLELDCTFTKNVNDYSLDVWERRDRRILLVGYIVHDENCSDPLDDCDGMGKIITKHDDRAFYKHAGYNDDGGDANLEEQAALLARLKGEELDGFICDSEPLVEMWREGRKQGKVGTPYAVPLVYSDHSGYSVLHKEPNRRFDAVWIPDKCLMQYIQERPGEEAASYAREMFDNALDEYNKWITGDCWGVVVDVFERQRRGKYEHTDEDSCWGYIGSDYAESELKETLLYSRRAHSLSRKPTGGQEKILATP